jgi:hypothetical protein
MKQVILILFFIVLVFTSHVHAEEGIIFETYTKSVELEDGNSLHKLEIIFNALDVSRELNLSLTPRVENLELLIDERDKKCVLEEKEGFSFLHCPFPEGIEGKHYLEVSFESKYPVYEVKNQILYKSEYVPLYPTGDFHYFLRLPKGFVIPEEKDVSFFINPKPKSIYSDGQRIILSWQGRDVSSAFELSVLMEPVGGPTLSALRLLGLLILIALLGFGLALFLRKKKKVEVSYPALVEHEQVVVELLKNAEGNVLWQKQIQHKTGFSKVKVSRVIRSLVERGVIRKEPWGNTNKIHLIIELVEDEGLMMIGEDIGRSLLVEYTPTAKREEALNYLVDLFLGNGREVVLVSTQPSTSHYKARFKGVQKVRIINLPDQAAVTVDDEIPMTNLEYFSKTFETFKKDNVFIFEPLSNLILHVGVDLAYKFASRAQNHLSTLGVTFIAFLNREGHDKKEISNFENIFMKIAAIDDGKLKRVR